MNESATEFVDHGETGYLVDPESPSELADALRFALDNPDARDSWGSAARKKAAAEYSWQTAATETRRIYDRIL